MVYDIVIIEQRLVAVYDCYCCSFIISYSSCTMNLILAHELHIDYINCTKPHLSFISYHSSS